MILFKNLAAISNYIEKRRHSGSTTGFAPTMGALHRGHLSLIERSKRDNALTVCSIFINPTQFNDPRDLEKYPRPIERDIEMLAEMACEVLFLPDVTDIYPNGTSKLKNYDLGHLENFLEGASRPGHFKGVANVVDRLLEIVQPDRLYIGQKDFQQVKVIERLIKMEGRQLQIVVCPIEREENGLAMSSRNTRLTPEQRRNAAGISKTLFWIRESYKEYSPEDLKAEAIRRINAIPGADVDYLECCDANTFQLINNWNEAKSIVIGEEFPGVYQEFYKTLMKK